MKPSNRSGKVKRKKVSAMKQGWSRVAYNGYMRGYMAAKRAVGRGLAERWPRRVSD